MWKFHDSANSQSIYRQPNQPLIQRDQHIPGQPCCTWEQTYSKSSGKVLFTSVSSQGCSGGAGVSWGKEGSSRGEHGLPMELGSTRKRKASAQEQCVLGRQEGNICFCRRLCSCQEQEAQARGKKVLCGQRAKISFVMHA